MARSARKAEPNATEWRHVVVDADVARSAGLSRAPRAVTAVAVLQAIRDQPDVVAVFSIRLDQEWRGNPSPFAVRWRAELLRKGRTLAKDPPRSLAKRHDAWLEQHLAADALQARRKDAHLVAAAVHFDAPVLSGDVKSRNGFADLCPHAPPWSDVVWFVPSEPPSFKALTAWLTSRTPAPTLCAPSPAAIRRRRRPHP